jgi:hypothetical protein
LLLALPSIAVAAQPATTQIAAAQIQPIEKSPSTSQAIETASDQATPAATEIAYAIICETDYVNGSLVSCCIDANGNWSCVW